MEKTVDKAGPLRLKSCFAPHAPDALHSPALRTDQRQHPSKCTSLKSTPCSSPVSLTEMTDQGSIFSASEVCNISFTTLLNSEALHNAPRAKTTVAVEEERAKFRIWGAHIGAFAEYHASLDYRLRESETVRCLVITQLRLLQGGLGRLLAIMQHSKQ